MKIVYKKNKNITTSVRPHSSCNVVEMIWGAIVKRKVLVFSLLFLLVTLPIVYLVIKYQSPIQAAWFDDTFAYRQTVAITNAGTAQTDFQVAITLNTSALITAGKMQSDCDDIRITDISGKLLPHWIETGTNACNTTTTAIWTKVPSISTTGTTIFVYYGNPSASNVQNGDNTFEFFDDFSGGTSKWTTDSGTWNITSGEYVGSGTTFFAKTTNYTLTNGVVETRQKIVSGSYYHGTFARYTDSNNFYGLNITGQSDRDYILKRVSGATTELTYTAVYTADNAFHITKGVFNGTSISFYKDGTLITPQSGTNPTTDSAFSSGKIALGGYVNSGQVNTDWIFVRKYAATEPSVASPTNEEKSSGPVAYWKFDEGYGTNVKDQSSNVNNGTINGATWQSEDQCISGKCLYFTSTNNINIADPTNNSLDFGTGDFTISTWIKTGNSADNRNLFRKGAGDGLSGWRFGLQNGVPDILIGDTVGFSNGNLGSTSIADNKWHHLSVVYDRDSNATGYVDGKNVGTVSISTRSGSVDNASAIIIGNSYTLFIGYLDEPKIYPYARTAAQVKADFAAKSSGSIKGSSAVLGSRLKDQGDYLSNGLVGYWKMDESAANSCTGGVNDSCDSSGNGRDASWGGSPTITSGKFSNSVSLPGNTITEYISLPNTALTGLSETSIAMWVNATTGGSDDAILSGASSANGNNAFLFYQQTNLAIYIKGSAWSSGVNLADSTWHHLVVTRNATTGLVQVFVDGTLRNSTSSLPTGTITIDANGLVLGQEQDSVGGGFNADQAFNGKYDDFRIYNRALSGKEVRDLYNWNPQPLLQHKFDENNGTPNDSSGNNFTTTVNGSPTWTQGKFGSAMQFNGSNTTVQIADDDRLSPYSLTLSSWVYRTGTCPAESDTCIIQNKENEYEWGIKAGNIINWAIYTTDQGWYWVDTGYVVPQNTWVYLSLIYNNSTVNLYANGVLVNSTPYIHAGITNTTSCYLIGGRDGCGGTGSVFLGKLDDVKVYPYARTSKQIVEDMNAGHPAGGSPVGSQVGYWKFDEGYGTNANDSSPQGNNGTITGADWTNSGKFGKALSFVSANSDYINMGDPTSGSLDFGTNSFSLVAWVKTTATGYQRIISKGHSGYTDGYLLQLYSGTGYIDSGIGAGGVAANSLFFYENDAVNDGNWHHVASVFDQTTKQARIYVDGGARNLTKVSGTCGTVSGSVLDFTGCNSLNASSTNSFQVGRNDTSGTEYFSGLLDEVKIYNSALTEDEIKIDMNRGAGMVLGSTKSGDIVRDGLVLYLNANDFSSYGGSGTTWYDISGQRYQATMRNLTSANWVTVDGIKAFETNDTDNQGFSVASWNQTTARTWEIWIKEKSTGIGWQTWIDNNGSERILFGTPNTNWSVYPDFSVSGVTAGQWAQFAFTMDDSKNVRMFKNGILVSAPGVYTNTLTLGSQTLYLLGDTGTEISSAYTGVIRAYNRKLVDEEVKKNFDEDAPTYGLATAYGTDDGRLGDRPPVAEWKMDEKTGTNAYDTSGNGNTGTLENSPSWVTGKIGSALDFSGSTTKRINVTPSGTTLDLTSTGTIEAWVYTNSFDTWNVIVARGNWGGDRSEFSLYQQSDGLHGYIADAAGYNRSTIPNASSTLVGGWHHISFTWDGSFTRIYLDGRLIDYDAQTLNAAPSGNLGLGNTYNGTYNYNGKIDHVRIFNYARTPAQIAYDYNRGGPVGWWKMDECQGTVANDSGGLGTIGGIGGNPGTITIGATGTQTAVGTCTTAGTAWGNGVNGKYSNSLNFDGTDDYVSVGSPVPTSLQATTAITLAAWIKPAANGGSLLYQIVGSQYDTGGYRGATIFIDGRTSPVGKIHFQIGDGSGWHAIENPAGAYIAPLNVWTHVVAVWSSGNQGRVYFNGVLDSVIYQNAWSGSIGYSAGQEFSIGRQNDASRYFNGKIDDVKIFNYALTTTQVKTLYNAGAAVQFAPSTGSP